MIGDYEEADAFDTATADPLQVAIKLYRLRQAQGEALPSWAERNDEARDRDVAVVALLLAWLRRQGALV